jgi:hypothetical protein
LSRGVLKTARSAGRFECSATFVAKLQPVRVFSFALRAEHLVRPLLRAQLVQQRLCVVQVGGVETFGEPVIDFGEQASSIAKCN